jgi:hypothetical protein
LGKEPNCAGGETGRRGFWARAACPTEEPEPEPQTPAFSRPASGTVTYTLKSYDAGTGVVVLKENGTEKTFTVAEAGLKTLFNAIYSPNAPASTDTVEAGKSAVTYTDGISAAVLDLFKITLGSNSTKVEIKGTALPGDNNGAYTSKNLIVIDVGLPGADNASLPTFYIPHRGLGTSNGNYPYIRFRVNQGASAVILADNSSYLTSGAGHPIPEGYFNGGCVEVMAGGKLRDGAYEGFPLGAHAVILNRSGSYLAVGPEDTFNYTGNGSGKYYAGWLIGPAAAAPRIVWDSGNAASNYVEVRPGEIATNAKLTAKKSVGLIYSVWFVDSAALTIDAAQEEVAIFDSGHGIGANGWTYKFYGSGNGTIITINEGNFLDGKFLNAATSETAGVTPVVAASGSITITGSNATGSKKEYGDGTGIKGKLITYSAAG